MVTSSPSQLAQVAKILSSAQRIVVKVGSSTLTRDGELIPRIFTDLSRQIARLVERKKQVVLVSSGAIALGSHRLGQTAASRSGRSIPAMQAAAAVILFLGGTSFGAAMSADPRSGLSGADGARLASVPVSVEDAAEAVYDAERAYRQALSQYGQLERGDRTRDYNELIGRAAALDALLAATQEAVRIAPSDPFFNGLLVNTFNEREQMLRQISSTRDGGWF